MMNLSTQNYDHYVFSKHPDYDETTVRKEFAKAVPLKTVVIYCYDPRATGIPAAVAREFDEVYPGDVITDRLNPLERLQIAQADAFRDSYLRVLGPEALLP